jgi:hypothetical protein
VRCSGSRGMFGIVRAARPSMPLSLSPEPEVKEPFASERADPGVETSPEWMTLSAGFTAAKQKRIIKRVATSS